MAHQVVLAVEAIKQDCYNVTRKGKIMQFCDVLLIYSMLMEQTECLELYQNSKVYY